MPSARTAERDREARLFLLLVARQRETKEGHEMVEELACRRMVQDVLAHRRVAAVLVAKLGDVERVLHEAHVEHEDGARGHPELYAEAHDREQLALLARAVQRKE